MNPEEPEGKTKQPYEKPRIRTIELVAEEVLAIGCKLAGVAAPGFPASCTAGFCSENGS